MKLVICLTEKRRIHIEHEAGVLEITTQFADTHTPERLEEYGQAWAKLWNTDIVMLVEEEK